MTKFKLSLLSGIAAATMLGFAGAANADPTAPCNAGVPAETTECGVNASATAVGATATGDTATAAKRPPPGSDRAHVPRLGVRRARAWYTVGDWTSTSRSSCTWPAWLERPGSGFQITPTRDTDGSVLRRTSNRFPISSRAI